MKNHFQHIEGRPVSYFEYARSTKAEVNIRKYVLDTFDPKEDLDSLISRVIAEVDRNGYAMDVTKQKRGQYVEAPETTWYGMSVQHIPSRRWVISASENMNIRKHLMNKAQ